MSESAGFVTIKDLAGATLATEDDDLIIQQGEETKRINLKTLGDLLVFLDKIEQVKTSTENGGINEIKATLSDGSTATFTTQNGHGIQKIEQTVKSDVSSGTNVITATLSDGQTCDFEIKNGDQGEKGDTGAALIDVVQKEASAASGGKNVISFKLNDGSFKDVEVYNGAKGETGEVSQEVLNQTVNEAIAGVVANAPEDFDTLKEMSDWISEHEDDATAMNTAILEVKNNLIKNQYVSSMVDRECYFKIQPTPSGGKFSKILLIDLFGGAVLITGSLVTDYKSFKFTRLSNGAWDEYASTKNDLNKIDSIYFDGNFFYVKVLAYSKFYIEGSYESVESLETLPSNATKMPITDLTHPSYWLSADISYTGDINNCEAGTWCSVNTITNSTNMPFVNGWATILTFRINNKSNYKQQICFYSNVDTLYIRTQIDGVWGKWVRLANQNDVKTIYSTTPQKIGTWIDGKDVYRVVIENELQGNILGQLAGTVESGAKIISAKGQITDVMGDTYIVPYFGNSSSIGFNIKGNSIYFVGYSNTSFTNVKMIVEYTK
jgi:hypothetical protein